MAFALGVGLMALAVVLIFARRPIIRSVTSRSLGSLAPGYAASEVGFCVYAGLVADIGFGVLGVAIGSAPVLLVAIVLFVLGTVVVGVGEFRTFRALKR